MLKSRWSYTLLITLLFPYVLFHLLWRGRKQPAYLQHVMERFGFYGITPTKPLIWLHAVSVGESRAAVPLIQQLQKHYPQYQILITHMTPTGRDAGETLFGDSVLRCYLPYDYPFAVKRFLAHFQPSIGLLMETEIWFNLIHACTNARMPLFLVNARLSARSARKYARFKHLTRESLINLSGIAAQTEMDAQRLTTLGAPAVRVMGNLKFDIPPPVAALQMGLTLRDRFGPARPVLLAASTRDGEEALLIDMLATINIPNLLTVIVPRHPQRFDDVAALLQKHAIHFQRRSAETPIAPDTKVVLGNSMGEMFAYYAACDIAFIGGSLLPYGGQNLIEACAVGRPVIVGPHTYNFAAATENAVRAGAAIQVNDADELALKIAELLSNGQKTRAMSDAGLNFSRSHQGATQRILQLIEPYLINQP